MLIQIARFEARYVLRNPLLWVTAAVTFGLLFAGMSVNGFDLGNEGGLLKNAAYAILRNYVIVSVFFMFVTTAFVATQFSATIKQATAQSFVRPGSRSSNTCSGAFSARSRRRRRVCLSCHSQL